MRNAASTPSQPFGIAFAGLRKLDDLLCEHLIGEVVAMELH